MDQSQERDYAEEQYNRDYCQACGASPCTWDGKPDGFHTDDMVPCTTCDGTGQAMMRGETHRGYDDPDYMDTCGICGGTGELPASMFSTDEEV